MQFVVNGVVISSFLPRLPELRDQIGVSNTTLGLLLTLGSLGGLLGSLVTSSVVGRLGTRGTLGLAGLALILFLPVIGLATAPWVFLLGFFGLAATDVWVDVAMNMQGSQLSAKRDVPIMNRLHGMWSVGSVLGGAVAIRLASNGTSLRVHLTLVAVVLLSTMFYVMPRFLSDDDALAPEPVAGSEAVTSVTNTGRRYLSILAILGFVAMVTELVPSDWSAIRLEGDFNLEAGPAGLGFVVYMVGMVGMRLSGDWLQSRIGGSRVLTLSVWTAALGLAIFALAPSHPLVLVGLFIAGIGNGILFPRLYDLAAQAPGKKGAGMAAMASGQRFGAVVAPSAVGLIAGIDGVSIGVGLAIVLLPSAAVMIGLRRAV